MCTVKSKGDVSMTPKPNCVIRILCVSILSLSMIAPASTLCGALCKDVLSKREPRNIEETQKQEKIEANEQEQNNKEPKVSEIPSAEEEKVQDQDDQSRSFDIWGDDCWGSGRKDKIKAKFIKAKKAKIRYAQICALMAQKLKSEYARIHKACIDKLKADKACIDRLKSQEICTDDLLSTRACINEANIDQTCANSLSVNDLCNTNSAMLNNVQMYQPVRASAVLNQNTTYTLGDDINFDTVLSDPNGDTTTSPFTYTAPLCGEYLVTVQIDQINLQGSEQILGNPVGDIEILVNGDVFRQALKPFLTFHNEQTSTLCSQLKLNAGDVVTVKYFVRVMTDAGGFESFQGTVDIEGNGTRENQSVFKIHYLSSCDPLPCQECFVPCEECTIGCPQNSCEKPCNNNSSNGSSSNSASVEDDEDMDDEEDEMDDIEDMDLS